MTSTNTALRLHFTNAEVRETNFEKLSSVNQPVKTVLAQHKGRNATKAGEEEADNLHPELQLCLQARVMLTTNLWTELGACERIYGLYSRYCLARGPGPYISPIFTDQV
jgi:ATP-dependent DNA helicase PIF1